jgi:protein SCO1/2
VRDPAPDVSGVVLDDAANGGQPFAMRADAGELLVVYFGYTACPDICPTTLADFRSAVRRLDDDRAAAVDVAMITVDPMRDDAERLTSYVQSFFAGSHALRTEDAALLRSAADAFGADYQVVIDGDDIEVGHTAFLYAIDAAGLIQLQWPFGATSEDMASDLEYLLEGMQ